MILDMVVKERQPECPSMPVPAVMEVEEKDREPGRPTALYLKNESPGAGGPIRLRPYAQISGPRRKSKSWGKSGALMAPHRLFGLLVMGVGGINFTSDTRTPREADLAIGEKGRSIVARIE